MLSSLDLPVNLRHSVLSMLMYSDEFAPLIRNLLPLECWVTDALLLKLVDHIYQFISTYEKAPKQHIEDIIVTIKPSDEQKPMLRALIDNNLQKMEDLNAPYVMECVKRFYRQNMIKQTIQRVIPLIDQPDKLDEIESLVLAGIKKQIDSFDPGSTLEEGIERLRKTAEDDQTSNDYIKTRIEVIDRRWLMPRRKALWTLMGLSGLGKTWGAVHLGKCALVEGKRVLHISTEIYLDELE